MSVRRIVKACRGVYHPQTHEQNSNTQPLPKGAREKQILARKEATACVVMCRNKVKSLGKRSFDQGLKLEGAFAMEVDKVSRLMHAPAAAAAAAAAVGT